MNVLFLCVWVLLGCAKLVLTQSCPNQATWAPVKVLCPLCTALVLKRDFRTCAVFCAKMQLECVGAWNEVNDKRPCEKDTAHTCDAMIDSVDFLCQCKPPTQRPTTKQSTTKQPTTKQPTTNQPTTRKPNTRRPTTKEPTTGGRVPPTTAWPTAQKPTQDKPTQQSGNLNPDSGSVGTRMEQGQAANASSSNGMIPIIAGTVAVAFACLGLCYLRVLRQKRARRYLEVGNVGASAPNRAFKGATVSAHSPVNVGLSVRSGTPSIGNVGASAPSSPQSQISQFSRSSGAAGGPHSPLSNYQTQSQSFSQIQNRPFQSPSLFRGHSFDQPQNRSFAPSLSQPSPYDGPQRFGQQQHHDGVPNGPPGVLQFSTTNSGLPTVMPPVTDC